MHRVKYFSKCEIKITCCLKSLLMVTQLRFGNETNIKRKVYIHLVKKEKEWIQNILLKVIQIITVTHNYCQVIYRTYFNDHSFVNEKSFSNN